MTESEHERPDPEPQEDLVLSRRGFLKGAGGLAIVGGGLSTPVVRPTPTPEPAGVESLSGEVNLMLEVNGERRSLKVEPRTSLLSALRHRLEPALTGAKEVCGRGNCGACTVLLDGQPVYACLVLAVRADGHKITTVEGLGQPEHLSPVQEAFCAKDAAMCGFCTPGFVVSATALLESNPAASRTEIVEGLCGNLCRCGTYPYVFDAVEAAGQSLRTNRGGGQVGGPR